MHILAIETTAKTGTLAANDASRLLLATSLDPLQRSARSLAPGIAALLAAVGWAPGDVQLVAVATGPGSFTGLRVGVATAKVFAYAVGAAVIGVNALEAIAAAAPDDVSRIETAIDAQRGDVVVQSFQRDAAGQFRSLGSSRLESRSSWIESQPSGAVVSGPGLEKCEKVPSQVRVLPAELWQPQAAVIAKLAYRDYVNGRRDDLWSLLPVYSRRAAAEEQWEKR